MSIDPEAGVRAAGGDRLAGRRVVVTRPRPLVAGFDGLAGLPTAAGGDDLITLLESAGADPLWFPAARIEGPSDAAALERAAARAAAGGYDWIVFTSANAVERFRDALVAACGEASHGRSAATVRRTAGGEPALSRAIPEAVRIACVGPATAAALASWGVAADLVPGDHVGDALVTALAATGELRGSRVLFPRAAGARRTVPEGLRSMGSQVEEVVAYRTVPALERADDLRRLLDAGRVDAITFMAGSAVEGFVAGAGTGVGGAAVAVIGPVTAAVARRCGLFVDVTATEHTAAGLVRALAEYWIS